MADSTISRGWLRHLACLGRSRPPTMQLRASPEDVRFATPGLTEAFCLAFGLASRPRATSWRPSASDLVEPTI